VPSREATACVHDELNGQTTGCNPAHRSLPLAMAVFLPDTRLAEVVIQEAVLTHDDLLAGDVAAAVVVLCRELLHGIAWHEALFHASENRTELTREALTGVSEMPLNTGGFAVMAAGVRDKSGWTGKGKLRRMPEREVHHTTENNECDR
jgi:hypothetical protein